MTTFKDKPYVSFAGKYHDEIKCPCGGMLYSPNAQGVRRCDGLGFAKGKGPYHYWRMTNDLQWEQVEEPK